MRPREFAVIKKMDRARRAAYKDDKVGDSGLSNLVDIRDGKGMLRLIRSLGAKVKQ